MLLQSDFMKEELVALVVPVHQTQNLSTSNAKAPVESTAQGSPGAPLTPGGNDDGSSKQDKEAQKNDSPLSNRQKLKLFMRDYGSTVIVFHITQSLALLGLIYTAFSAGLDMTWVVQELGLEGKHVDKAAGASTFIVAYAVNKVLAPLRFAITFSCTPFIVRYLRRVGILKVIK